MITTHKFRKALVAAGYRDASITITGNTASGFATPEPDWVTGEFREAFSDWLFEVGATWKAGRYDCRQFALTVVARMLECWGCMNNVPADDEYCSLAVGLLYVPGHALVICGHVGEDRRTVYVQAYEPQPAPVAGTAVFQLVSMQPYEVPTEDKVCATIFVP